MEKRGGGKKGKGRRGGKGMERKEKENGDHRPPTIFGLKVALIKTSCLMYGSERWLMKVQQ